MGYRRKPWMLKRRLRLPIIRFPSKMLILATMIFLVMGTFNIIDKNLTPAIITIAQAKAHQLAGEAINKAVYDKVLMDVNYNELVIVHKDAQQRITMMQANSVRIGRIISQANIEIRNSLNNLGYEILEIPLGQALGSRILANYGPKINVKIQPYGTVDVGFTDEFQQAGINQVRHILYLNIDTNIKIVIPTIQEDEVVRYCIPIAESVIVGDVPDTYLGFGNK